jgi:hypothetical protein
MENASMSREKVACTVDARATPVAPAAGVLVDVGGRGAVAAVVKLHETAPARATPSDAVIVGDRVAVYDVPVASGACGLSVAVPVALLYETVAGTLPLGPVREKLELVTVAGSSAWSNDARTLTLGLTPVAPPAGKVDVTPGGCGWCVVNAHVTAAARGVPSAAFTVVAIFAV